MTNTKDLQRHPEDDRIVVIKNLEENLKKIGYSDLTVERVMQCSKLLQDINSGMSDSIFLRTNCDWPKKPHTHGTTLGMAFSGAGTVMVKDSFQFTAEEQRDKKTITSRPTAEDVYSLSVNDLVVFEGIWHYAPPLKGDENEAPRTNLII